MDGRRILSKKFESVSKWVLKDIYLTTSGWQDHEGKKRYLPIFRI